VPDEQQSIATARRMRAISPEEWGPAELLREIELERPEPGPVQVLVRVHAAGVNPSDWKQRESGGLGLWGEPPILGYDVSGVIEETGLGVELYAPGDEVFGMVGFPLQGGAYADYVVCRPRHLAPKPPRLSHAEAAALPLVGLTAWQVLVDTADVQPGQRVLVHAAAGGLGHVAIQIAKSLGAHVIGTARVEKHAFLRELGADELFDYSTGAFEDAISDVDVVLDTVGGDYPARSLATLKPGGILICLAMPMDPPESVRLAAAERGVRTSTPLVEIDRLALTRVTELVEQGELRPHIDSTFPLVDAAAAHERGESGRTTGKIVLTVAQ
jgi:NADPH:quinone reductase-like Zn-dependent oxidoreductase